MFSNSMKTISFLMVAITCLSGWRTTLASAQQAKRPFAVADDIELTHFGQIDEAGKAIRFSPDKNYVAVWTERGRLDLNRVEDSLRFYRSRDVKDFLEHPDESRPPSPVWIVNRSDKVGEDISNWRWLADSSGVAFLERTGGGRQRLVLADLRMKTVKALTSALEAVGAFDVRDREHYVYTAADPAEQKKRQAEGQMAAIVGTGRQIGELILPERVRSRWLSQKHYLRAVVGGQRFEVKSNGVPIVPQGLALSPDGRSLVTKLPIPDVPTSWETLYPPPYATSRVRVRAGRQNGVEVRFMLQYVRIDLQKGSVQALTDAPISIAAGWGSYGDASWSNDGESILLPDTFIKSTVPSRPCVAVVDVRSRIAACVEVAKRIGQKREDDEEGYHTVWGASFVHGDRRCISVGFFKRFSSGEMEENDYHLTSEGAWQLIEEDKKSESGVEENGLSITVRQGLNKPPLLVASSREASRVIWNPNPQLENIELGQAKVYTWKDKRGQEWKSGLYIPVNYQPGHRYPLVIQTHGFLESEFSPSGIYPTAFAARALAATGIVVLQVGAVGECGLDRPDEGACNVAGYEIIVKQLVSEGLVDPDKIGIIGFSRTCYHVMATLAFGSLPLRAASITDGGMTDYLGYMLFPDVGNEYDSIIGAKPFGEGLQQWLTKSPGFNLERVTTPLLVVGEGPLSLLSMWQPYAGLRYLHKPVDLMLLNTDEHVLTNPAVRMASQGGSVDWFRFWLRDYEDPDPAKAGQYNRWRELRKMEEEENAGRRGKE
jgi:hypothetical protein